MDIAGRSKYDRSPPEVSKTCLLIMPTTLFHYPKIFCSTLEQMGYSVTLSNDDYPNNPLGKVLSKLDMDFGRWWTRRTIRSRFLRDKHWDLILIIKGRGIGKELIADLRRYASRIVGYHYDALAYDPAVKRWSHFVDRVSTFDPRDALENGWPLIELFADCDPTPKVTSIRYRFNAIMRNHSNRLAYIQRILDTLGREDSFIYLYEKDLLSFLSNFLHHPYSYWKLRRHIHWKPLPYKRFKEILSSSEFTIDYAHPAQTGCTMRSVEVRALGSKLITNNLWHRKSGLFDEGATIFCEDRFDTKYLLTQVEKLSGSIPNRVVRRPEEFMCDVLGTSEV